MNNLIELDPAVLKNLSNKRQEGEVLFGLNKQKVGFIISGPDVGKGYLSLSIAYELATTIKLLGISNNPETLKVLYWPIEDGVDVIAERIMNHFSEISPELSNIIRQNVFLWDSTDPICCSSRSKGFEEDFTSTKNRENLIRIATDFDVVIIDTLREAAGSADEVEDDHIVKSALQEIATESNVAVIATHHLNKAAIKGIEKITNVSASGFSRTLANSRLQLFMHKDVKKTEENTFLTHIKSNNINKIDKLINQKIEWSSSSILFRDISSLEQLSISSSPLLKNSMKGIDESQPKSVIIDKSKLSKQSIEKANAYLKENQIISDNDINEYTEYLQKKKKNKKP